MEEDFFAAPTPAGPKQNAPLGPKRPPRPNAKRSLPVEGELVTIRWPGGPYHFVIKFECVDESYPAPMPGYVWLRGLVVSPVGDEHRTVRTFHVRPYGKNYTLLPKKS